MALLAAARRMEDLDPGSVVRVSVPPPRGDVYLGAEGEFVDNVRIEDVGENFIINGKKSEPIDYYITIDGVRPAIESPHLEKYKEN